MRCGPRAVCNTDCRSAEAQSARVGAGVGCAAARSPMIAIAKRSSGGARKAARIVFQAALVIVVAAVFYGAFVNAADHLARANISSGFRFWNNTAGFDISKTLIAYSSSTSTCGRAFWVGLLNTLLVAALG